MTQLSAVGLSYFKTSGFAMKALAILTLALSAPIATPAFAGTLIVTGNTTGGPVFRRPIAGKPPTALSNIGTAVRYSVNPFTVSVTGNYNLRNTTNYDSYLGVYANSFNAANPLLNALEYDDDDGPGVDAAINALRLSTGTTYYAINTGYDNSDFGAFSLRINGPGNITSVTAVPEPATWMLLIAGFGLMGAALRRRNGTLAAA
jgi:hypothetical protein